MLKKGSYLRRNWLVMTLVALGILMFGNSSTSLDETPCVIPLHELLTVAQGNWPLVGGVDVWNDNINLYIRFGVWGDWRLMDTHVAVCTDLESIPVNKKGNPVPGQFPYHSSHEPPVTRYTYEIPLDSWTTGTTLYIAAHCDVRCITLDFDETAWGGCLVFPYGTRWACYIVYTVQGC